MTKQLGLKPSTPDTSEQERIQREQLLAAQAEERLLKEGANAELSTTLRRRRGGRSLMSQYANQFGNTLG